MERTIAVTTMRERSWRRSDRYMKMKRPMAPLEMVRSGCKHRERCAPGDFNEVEGSD